MVCKVTAQKNLLPDTTGFCAGDTAVIEIKEKLDKNASILWTTPYSIIQNTKKISAFKFGGKYYVKVVSNKQTFFDSTYVKIYFRPRSLLRDSTLCKGKPIVLDAKNNGMKYFWNTGDVTQKIKVETSGRYWVRITNFGCSIIDTAIVKVLPGNTLSFTSEMQFCLSDENKSLSIKTQPNTKINWSTGSTASSINVTKEGLYWVKTDSKNCGVQVDSVRVKLKACDCEMMIPNSFTPNEDNKNDYFYPITQCDYTTFLMVISDKWGNVVYQTNNLNGKWDGRFKGNLCPEENYVYHIESTEAGTNKKLVRNGMVSLFR